MALLESVPTGIGPSRVVQARQRNHPPLVQQPGNRQRLHRDPNVRSQRQPHGAVVSETATRKSATKPRVTTVPATIGSKRVSRRIKRPRIDRLRRPQKQRAPRRPRSRPRTPGVAAEKRPPINSRSTSGSPSATIAEAASSPRRRHARHRVRHHGGKLHTASPAPTGSQKKASTPRPPPAPASPSAP